MVLFLLAAKNIQDFITLFGHYSISILELIKKGELLWDRIGKQEKNISQALITILVMCSLVWLGNLVS